MQRDLPDAPRPSAGRLPCLLSLQHCLMSLPGEGANMDLKNRSKICWVAAVLLLISTAASAEEWWKDSFAAEGSAPCDNNDTIVTFTDKAVEMWEVGCSLERVQKIKGLDAIVLDMTCSDGETTETRRELLLKLHDNKVMRYPRQEVLQRCSELKARPAQAPKVDTSP
ncbi:MAG: hypothetical protein EOS58_23835 [Mesorhizobium sp.]|nr:hypothetical protein EJ073_06235 [Mesorhizobium sp. M4B.F.Ca.ET.058.02.1.1]RVC45495.1 hypothetical protein EN781_09615 [Mesorhizobium sp. M4A.F.Ca.ET.090.04.2.1]RVC78775.1 hypothetical protein EN745_17915 [Mesorhizobium sp. M4A.F.Ca.ET.022.05.2.1]RVD72363.1 hypothetical protein EN751_10490 [Mesorhizobium sp. M4A.F.Ca.ET.029.04.2.1]RWC56022.1 MAG: hypothetical protein EOS54_07305 [Mesorhizobium sp.]